VRKKERECRHGAQESPTLRKGERQRKNYGETNMISSEIPHPLPGPFSEIQCDKFWSQNAPHSWITVRDHDLPRDCVAEWRLRVEFLWKTDSGYPS